MGEHRQGMGFQLTAVGLFALVTGCVAVPWAFLVTGSRTWDNYRHHADVAHAYHRIVQGIPPERIISFQYNDVPTLSENPYPGTLFNKPSGKSAGVNVNSGFNKSYTGANVNKHNVLAALTCNASAGPCMRVTPKDDIFIFWAGHGSDGMLLMPDMRSQDAVYADELLTALQQVKFNRMVIYIEACESGSMFAHLPSDINVYAVTAATAQENSYPIYCCSYFHDACMVNKQDIGACLGDMFSVAWLEAADSNPKQTLKQSFANAKTKTAEVGGNPGSTVTAFGDLSFVSDPLSRFIGAGCKMSNHTQYSTVGVRPAHQPVTGAAPGLEQATKELSHTLLDKMPYLVTVDESAGELQLERFGCYRELNALIDQLCAPILLGASDKRALPDLSSLFPIYHQVFYGISKHACMKHYEVEAARVFKEICNTSTK